MFVGRGWPIVSRRAMALRMPSKCFAGLAGLATVALGIPVVVAGCFDGTGDDSSSSSTAPAGTTDPPVIESLNMSESALGSASTTSTYTVFGSITYADDDDVVTAFQVEVPVLGHTYTFPLPDPVSTAYGESISFPLSTDAPLGGAGLTNYIVTLVNKSGAVSAAGPEQSVDLE
jgi:hypothetical protein